MPYITTAERIGMEKGIEEGKKKGEIKKAQCDVVDVLETRFEAVPRHLVKEIKGIEEIAVLSSLHRKAVLIKDLEEFTQIMNKMLSDAQGRKNKNKKARASFCTESCMGTGLLFDLAGYFHRRGHHHSLSQ